MHKLRYLYFCLLAVATTFLSCQEEELDYAPRDITVEQAKSYFQSLSLSRNGRHDIPEIHWEKSWYDHTANGDILFFPLAYGKEKYLSSTGSPDVQFEISAATYAIAYQRGGEVTMELAQWVPTGSYETGFTGVIRCTDWKDNPLRYYYFRDGIFTHAYRAGTTRTTGSNGRPQGCQWVDTWTCTVREGPDYCVWDGGYEICDGGSERGEPLLLEPEDPFSGGGGPSDGDGPSMCPHPFIQGQYILCGTTVCPEGYRKDLNGDCVRTIDDTALKAILKSHKLNQQDYQTLAEAINTFKSTCANKAVYNYLRNNNIKLCFDKNTRIGNPGGYQYTTNTIFLDNINNINALAEELFHAFQDSFYGGMDQFTNVGRSNIEFEAKLLHD